MTEKIKYNNGVSEELKIVTPEIDNEKAKNDLFVLEMGLKLEKQQFTKKDIERLNIRYSNEIAPIVSAMDYETIGNTEINQMIDNIEGMQELDKELIYLVIYFFYGIDNK